MPKSNHLLDPSTVEYDMMKYKLTSDALGIALWDMDVVSGDPVNPNNRFKWSQEFRYMLGFSDENDFPNILSSWSDRLHPDDKERTLDAFAAHMNDYTGKTPYDIEYRLMLKNGHYRDFHAFGTTLRDHKGIPLRVAGALEDIHEKKQMEKTLKKQHEEIRIAHKKSEALAHWYKSILNAIPFPVSVTDENMRWTFVNRAVELFLGTKFEDMIGKPCSNWGAHICNTENCGVACAKRGLKRTYFDQNDRSHLVDVEILKDLDDNPIGFVEIVQDISELKEMTHKIEATFVELEHALIMAQEASHAKSAFLAKMSHEIRTPMNAIIGMAELALRENVSPIVHEHVYTIKQAGTNLLSIINDVLDFSKIESGRLEIVPGDYFFSSLVNDVVNIIRMRVVDSQLRFVVNVDCNIPNALFGDEIRIRQVMLNVLSNAVKYTKKGYVAFTIIGDVTDEDTLNLTIEVTDSGRGIKPEDIGKLFGDFAQLDLAENRGVEGTGLGLSITRSLVRAMDGDITVSSEYGKGSTFTTTLPQKIRSHEKLAVVENPDEKRVLVYERREIFADSIICTIDNLGVSCTLVSTDTELYEEMINGTYHFVFIASALFENVPDICSKSDVKIVLLAEFGETITNEYLSTLAMPAYSISVANILNGVSDKFSYDENGLHDVKFTAPGASVLVVDDVKTNLQVAEGLLSPYKMQIELCKSGMEAIEAVRSKHYDLVFMDHMMPEMDGIEATSRIRTLDSENPFYKDMPIIALTANAVSGMKEMFLNNGFSDYLSKPIDVTKLNAILNKWVPKEKQEKNVGESDVSVPVPESADHQNFIIEGINIKKGIAMLGGNVENYRRTLSIFMRDGIEKTEEIKKCLETDNLPLYVTYVHALKSAAANVGALELSDMAKALEAAGQQEDLAFIQTHNDKLLSALDSIISNISNELKAGNQEEGNEAVDISLLKVGLVKLEEALDSMNPRAIKAAVKDIQPFANAPDIGDMVEIILQNTLVGEYEDAASMIKTFLEEKI